MVIIATFHIDVDKIQHSRQKYCPRKSLVWGLGSVRFKIHRRIAEAKFPSSRNMLGLNLQLYEKNHS